MHQVITSSRKAAKIDYLTDKIEQMNVTFYYRHCF